MRESAKSTTKGEEPIVTVPLWLDAGWFVAAILLLATIAAVSWVSG